MKATSTLIFGLLACAAVAQAAVKQEGAGLYNCAGAQQLGKSVTSNYCADLCGCMGTENRAFSASAIKAICVSQCKNCVVAANDAKQCPVGAGSKALPEACKQGLQFNAVVTALVNKCVAKWQANPASVLRKQTPGV